MIYEDRTMAYDDEDSKRDDGRSGKAQQALDQQQKLLAVLSASLDELQSRLTLVLRPERAERPEPHVARNEAIMKDPEPPSPLLSQIGTTNRHLEGLIGRLQTIGGRVE